VHPASNPDQHPLARRLQTVVALSQEELEAVRALPFSIRETKRREDIVREGDRPSECCLLMEGFAFRYKMLEDGRRQILSFHVPGDVPDLMSLHLKTMDHSLCTLGPAKLGFVQHSALHQLHARFPRVAGAFWRETLIDSAVFREWMVGLGRRDALGRTAHLLCELYVRLRAVGRASDGGVELPINQADLADALGISAVHANRSLQELRAQELITLRSGTLVIHRWDRLAQIGEFDPEYLHLNPGTRAEPP
jgi:CRP-like cAMP-binding protein